MLLWLDMDIRFSFKDYFYSVLNKNDHSKLFGYVKDSNSKSSIQ